MKEEETIGRETAEQVYSPRLSEIAAGGTVANGRQIGERKRKSPYAKKDKRKETIFPKRSGGWVGEKRARKLDERISTNNTTKRQGFTECSRFYGGSGGERGDGTPAERFDRTRWKI